MKHKRFLLFSFSEFYPGGGLDDIRDEFDTLNDAMAYIDNNLYDLSEYAYLFDCEERQIIWDRKQ